MPSTLSVDLLDDLVSLVAVKQTQPPDPLAHSAIPTHRLQMSGEHMTCTAEDPGSCLSGS